MPRGTDWKEGGMEAAIFGLFISKMMKSGRTAYLYAYCPGAEFPSLLFIWEIGLPVGMKLVGMEIDGYLVVFG